MKLFSCVGMGINGIVDKGYSHKDSFYVHVMRIKTLWLNWILSGTVY